MSAALALHLTRAQVTALAVLLTHRKRTNDWMDTPLDEVRAAIDPTHAQIHSENFAAFEISFHRPRTLPAADTITLGAIETSEREARSFTEVRGREPLEGMLNLDLPPFDGIEDAQMGERAR